MADTIAPKATDQAELDQERERCAAKMETYAAISNINQGYSTVVAGLDRLKNSGLLNEEWADAKGRIDNCIREVWNHQAMLNSSLLSLLAAIEESDVLQCIGRQIERQSRQKKEELALIGILQSGADRGRPN